jgi:hypothetical protein
MLQFHVKIVLKVIVFITKIIVRKFYLDGFPMLGKYLLNSNLENTLFISNILKNGGIIWIILINIALKLLSKIIYSNALLMR